jgi:DNA (cytosine-5)-methyltransferase 1
MTGPKPQSSEQQQLSPADLIAARKRLGLSQTGLAEALRLGKNGDRTIRRWEAGEIPITGPASVAIELLLAQARA